MLLAREILNGETDSKRTRKMFESSLFFYRKLMEELEKKNTVSV